MVEFKTELIQSRDLGNIKNFFIKIRIKSDINIEKPNKLAKFKDIIESLKERGFEPNIINLTKFDLDELYLISDIKNNTFTLTTASMKDIDSFIHRKKYKWQWFGYDDDGLEYKYIESDTKPPKIHYDKEPKQKKKEQSYTYDYNYYGGYDSNCDSFGGGHSDGGGCDGGW